MMAQTQKKNGLDLSRVLSELDKGNKSFYRNLSDEERKSYVPLVLMRYMSSLSDQSSNNAYAIIAANDLVNVGFWQLSKHPELQHLLLCLTGLGSKQYRPWISNKNKISKTKLLDEFFMELHPGINQDELQILKDGFDDKSFKKLCHAAGKSDQETKYLMEDFKKMHKDG
jgi:hypothetical protein